MDPLVSVLMSVYNTKSYIHRAINSVLAQTYKNIELIVIDDGSTDGCNTILDEYAQLDSRIFLIHQTNHGQSFCKRLEMNTARGEFVTFVDSDDWIAPNAIEDMMAVARREASDLVISDYWVDTPQKKEIVKQQPNNLSSHNVFIQLCKGEIHGILCNKLIKKTDTLINIFNNVPLHITYREDTWICCHLLSKNIKISYIPKAFYHWYIDRPGNSTTSSSPKKLLLSVEVYQELERLLDDSYKSILYTRKKDLLFDAFLSKQYDFLRNYYPETKALILEDTRHLTYLTPHSKCLALALKGHPHIAYTLYHTLIPLIKLKEKIGL